MKAGAGDGMALRRGGEQVLAFSPVAFHTAPDTGTLIVTSGEGGVYPRGIPVGTVKSRIFRGRGRQQESEFE